MSPMDSCSKQTNTHDETEGGGGRGGGALVRVRLYISDQIRLDASSVAIRHPMLKVLPSILNLDGLPSQVYIAFSRVLSEVAALI